MSIAKGECPQPRNVKNSLRVEVGGEKTAVRSKVQNRRKKEKKTYAALGRRTGGSRERGRAFSSKCASGWGVLGGKDQR